jgi:hypothetical protein
MGAPAARLPFNQLVLGRTTPPWNSRAWRTETCVPLPDQEVGGVMRVTLGPDRSSSQNCRSEGCRFLAIPRGLPARDVTLTYRVRFAPGFAWDGGGGLPGLTLASTASQCEDDLAGRCSVSWTGRGRAVVRVTTRGRRARHEDGDTQVMFENADFKFLRGRWNSVLLRVRLNSFDAGCGWANRDGTLTVCINGRAASASGLAWGLPAATLLHHVRFQVCRDPTGGHEGGRAAGGQQVPRRSAASQATWVDFAAFAVLA